ncbi:DinB family protein [Paenibacillus sp. GCM10027628]|uniref:DinB family protein n=1 Tax=Paenibacillus sp. GCM10027628 TaxID=3273413 RepID=UPI0036455746
MGSGQAKLVLEVDNLQASLAFYTTKLGWELTETEPSGHAVLLNAVPDYQVVLLQKSADGLKVSETVDIGDFAVWLHPQAQSPQSGDHVYMWIASTNEMANELRGRGIDRLEFEEDAGSTRKLFVFTPDGYIIVYWEELYPSDEEILAEYEAGADKLERLLLGASPEVLDWAESPGKWSIRQQAMHLIDLELVTIHKVKFALAEPGRTYHGNGFSQDDWCAILDYARRPIEPELAMFRAMREHIAGLCRHLPDALQRKVITSNREESVAKLLKMMNGHAAHHIRAMTRLRETFSKI